MKRQILWIDNDPAYLQPYVERLGEDGFTITRVDTAGEGEQRLVATSPDLVILDVMIPTRSAEEEERYPPSETSNGYRTGVVFWRRNRALLKAKNIPLLVFTVRLDEGIRAEFAKEGLTENFVATKYDLSEPELLLEKIKQMTKETP